MICSSGVGRGECARLDFDLCLWRIIFFFLLLRGGHAGRVCFSLVIVAIPADAGAIPRKTPLWRWNRFVVLFSFVYFFMIEIRLKKNENVKGKHVWL